MLGSGTYLQMVGFVLAKGFGGEAALITIFISIEFLNFLEYQSATPNVAFQSSGLMCMLSMVVLKS